MYLQRAGGNSGGIFSGLAGHDDDPVFVGNVGEYTHTGYFTPKRHGDDQNVWVGEYTHMGAVDSSDQLLAKLVSMTQSQFDAARASDSSKIAAAKGTGLSMSAINKIFLKAAKSRQAQAPSGGGGGGSSGGGTIFGMSPTMVVGGAIGLAVLGFAASRAAGGARSNPGRRRRRRRSRR